MTTELNQILDKYVSIKDPKEFVTTLRALAAGVLKDKDGKALSKKEAKRHGVGMAMWLCTCKKKGDEGVRFFHYISARTGFDANYKAPWFITNYCDSKM
jgi:hypothetical protein